MSLLLLSALVAFLITVLTTPLAIQLAKRFNLVDDPSRPHPAHIQQRIVPKAGGISIFLGIIIPLFLFLPIDKHLIGIIIGCLILLIIGLMDDLMVDLSPYVRLLIQFIAAVVVVGFGIGITFVTNPLGGILRLDSIIIPIQFFGTHNIIVLADILAFFWIVWMMNMVNWSWGVDGQMPGIIAVAAITIGVIAYKLYIGGDFNQYGLANIAFITAGVAAGFLIFNWHPAKIFSGDSGANILGFMIAILCILSSAKLATALIVMLVPTIDFFYTFFRRILHKKSPFKGDNKHLHHLLLRRGWTHQQISLFYIASSVILAIIAPNLTPERKLFIGVGISIVILGGLLWLHYLTQKVSQEKEIK